MDVFWVQGSIPDAHPEMDAQVVVQGNEWMCVFLGRVPTWCTSRQRQVPRWCCEGRGQASLSLHSAERPLSLCMSWSSEYQAHFTLTQACSISHVPLKGANMDFFPTGYYLQHTTFFITAIMYKTNTHIMHWIHSQHIAVHLCDSCSQQFVSMANKTGTAVFPPL